MTHSPHTVPPVRSTFFKKENKITVCVSVCTYAHAGAMVRRWLAEVVSLATPWGSQPSNTVPQALAKPLASPAQVCSDT